MLVEKLADVIPTVMFMVGWQRAVLLGPRSGDHLPGLRWTPRETAYLLHLIKVFGITFVLVSALMFTVGSLDPGTIGVVRPSIPSWCAARRWPHRYRRFIVSDAAGAARLLRPAPPPWMYPSRASRLGLWPRQRLTIIGSLFLTFLVGPSSPPLATLLVLDCTGRVSAPRKPPR